MNTRHLAGSIARECLCRNCVGPDSNWKRYVKTATRRSVRRSAMAEIRAALDSDANHDADAEYIVNVCKLSILNVQNLRSVRS